jgi:putative redox protein
MEATARYLNNVKFEASARGHRLICDQPMDNGGSDEGMTPPEFLLAALATCAGYYAAQYLNARKLPTGGLEVRVNAEKAQAPARLASFHIEVSTPGLKEHREAERHQAGVLRAVKSCLIHNTLLGNPSIEVSLREASENVAPPAAFAGSPGRSRTEHVIR